jgi:hypothetical protein
MPTSAQSTWPSPLRSPAGLSAVERMVTNASALSERRLWFSSIPNSLISWDLAFFLRFPFGSLFSALLASLFAFFRSRAALQLEILALRHQLGVLQRSVKRPKLTAADRVLWAWLCAVWNNWRSPLFFVQPATVLGWHRKGFRLFWTRKIRWGKPGRPAVPEEIRDLIRTLSRENPLWGAPRLPSELLKLGIDIGETSVSKYMIRRRQPPSQTWRTFLENHVKCMVSVDFFTVPTIRFQILYVFLVLAHERRRILPRIRPPSGPHTNCGKRSLGTVHPVICCATGTGSSGRSLWSRSGPWASNKSYPHLARPGSARMSNG